MRLNVQDLGFFFTVLLMLVVAAPVSQASAEDVSSARQQDSQEVSSANDNVCEKGWERVWGKDGKPICIEPENVLKLVKSGGLSPEIIDKISVSEKRAHEVSENVYAFLFDYCTAVYNEGALGMVISSHIEKIPIPIYPDIQMHQCSQYGTQIHALSESSIEVSVFYEKDVQALFEKFEKKMANLEDDLVSNQQELLRLQDPNLDVDNSDEIDKVKVRNGWISITIQSYKDGLNTLRSLQ